jgi:Fic family protein
MENSGWDAWLEFFLDGVLSVATQAIEAAARIRDLFEADRDRIKSLGRPASSALRLHEHMQRRPYVTIQWAAIELGLSAPTVMTAARNLEKLGIVSEASGRTWKRLFLYARYFEILNEDGAPLPR